MLKVKKGYLGKKPSKEKVKSGSKVKTKKVIASLASKMFKL